MSVKEMWRINAVSLVLLIIINVTLLTLNTTAWIVLGIASLLVALFLGYRQGMVGGHEACAILETVRRTEDPQSPAYGQALDKRTLSRTWSAQRGLKGLFASALIPYAASCAYIIIMLVIPQLEAPVFASRVLAIGMASPCLPFIAHWHEVYNVLTPDIVCVLMLSPFVLPAALFAGYMQGPKLWQKSEQAMAQGRRRAKAKSRIVKKRTPRQQKPEI